MCGGIFTRCRRHPSLQESGATSRAWEPTFPPPRRRSKHPVGICCLCLLWPQYVVGGRIQTEELIASLPLPHPPAPVQSGSIIRQLFIPHQSPVPSCSLVRKVVAMDSWPSEYIPSVVCIAFTFQSDPEHKPKELIKQQQRTMDRVLPRSREISGNEQSRVSLRTNLKSTSIATGTMRNR